MSDPISHEMKLVAISLFGERLACSTLNGKVGVENAAAAIAEGVYGDKLGVDNSHLRSRFLSMCLTEPEIRG